MVNNFQSGCRLDSIDVQFDERRLVSDAGLLLPRMLADRLGLVGLVAEKVDLGDSPGAARPERKALSLIAAMLAGADSIDDTDQLRAGSTEAVLGQKVMAPSFVLFLSVLSVGWSRLLLGDLNGPGLRVRARVTMSVLSSISTLLSTKSTATRKRVLPTAIPHSLACHPLLATRADTGEVLGIRLRKGSANTQRGVTRLIDELIARVRKAGADGKLLVRADSGFWKTATFKQLEAEGVEYSIAVGGANKATAAATEKVPDGSWARLEGYPEPGLAEIAETTYAGRRLIVRRVRELSDQQELLPEWRHHPFITNRTEDIGMVEKEHWAHAVIELAIRDLKAGALAHFPSGNFSANSAWVQHAVIAHNLARWSQLIGLAGTSPRILQTFQRRLLTIPGRLVSSARRLTLRLPARWPWQTAFIEALT